MVKTKFLEYKCTNKKSISTYQLTEAQLQMKLIALSYRNFYFFRKYLHLEFNQKASC